MISKFPQSLAGPEFWAAEGAGLPLRPSDPQSEDGDVTGRLLCGQEDRGEDRQLASQQPVPKRTLRPGLGRHRKPGC